MRHSLLKFLTVDFSPALAILTRRVGTVVLLAAVAAPASALTIDFAGTVAFTDTLGGGVVPASVAAGDAVSGSITYDPNTPDIGVGNNNGIYDDPSAFFSLTIGSNTWTVTGTRIVIADDGGGLDKWEYSNGNNGFAGNGSSVFTGPGVLDGVLGAAFELRTFGPSILVTSDALLGTIPPFDISAADIVRGSLASNNQFSQWGIFYDIDRESLTFSSPPVVEIAAPGAATLLIGATAFVLAGRRKHRRKRAA